MAFHANARGDGGKLKAVNVKLSNTAEVIPMTKSTRPAATPGSDLGAETARARESVDHASGARRANSGLVHGGRRSADIVAFEDAVVSYFIEAADLLGVPKSVAAIYGICFASPVPLSFSEIDERLEISSGSISQGLRVLKDVGALKIAQSGRSVEQSTSESESDKPIDSSTVRLALARQRERYEPDLELRKLVLRWIEKRLQAQLKAGSDRLAAIIEAAPPAVATEALHARLQSLQTWHGKAGALLPLAKTFLKLT